MTSEGENYFSEGASDFIEAYKIEEKKFFRDEKDRPNFEFNKKVIVFAINPMMRANLFVAARNNISAFKKSANKNKYKISYYWSDEYNKLYKMISKDGDPKINLKYLDFPNIVINGHIIKYTIY